MSYTLRKSDGSLVIELSVGSTDSSKTSITLIGKNVSDFGKYQNENFIRLVENFSNQYEPPNSILGQTWFNRTTQQLNLKTTEGFVPLGPFAAPTTPSITINDSTIATTAFVHGVIPKGIIMLWSGATVPSGWALCDGQRYNNVLTPDLQSRFIMGARMDGQPGPKIGDVGGSSQITTVPAHDHSYSATTSGQSQGHTHGGVTSSAGQHTHVFPGDDQLSFAAGKNGWAGASVGSFNYDARSFGDPGGRMWQTSEASQHNHTFTTGNQSVDHTHTFQGRVSTTGSTAVDVLNPYYALAYIMKVI